MESQLTALERKIDDLLATVDPHDPNVRIQEPDTTDNAMNQKGTRK